MNTAEVLKWKNFSILLFKLLIVAWLISLIFHGFSQSTLFFGIKASVVVTMATFFWVFCARDENG